MKFNAGQTIGNYRIVRPLGKGAIGSVYEVEQIHLGVRYALKTFSLEKGSVELLRRRFLAEGKVLARLRHPNIVRVYDLDFDLKSGTPFFTMDAILDGKGESRALDDVSPGEVEETTILKWFGQMASALDYIHAKDIVHRDLKPGNILVDEFGSLVLTDFGVSRYVSEELRRQLSVTCCIADGVLKSSTMRIILGTHEYMAPEVKSGRPATAASDAYALGMIFYWLLTGLSYEGDERSLDVLTSFDRDWKSALAWLLNQNPGLRPPTLTEVYALLARQAVSSPDVPIVISGQGRPVVSEEEELRACRRKMAIPFGIIGGFGLAASVVLATSAAVRGPRSGLLCLSVLACFCDIALRYAEYGRANTKSPVSKKERPNVSQDSVATLKSYVCSHCGETFLVPSDSEDGQHFRCPSCGRKSAYDKEIDDMRPMVETLKAEAVRA